jgi:hypothetical protein
MPTFRHRAAIDAYVDEASPGSNHGDVKALALNGDGGSAEKALVYFKKPVEVGVNVKSATLSLFVRGADWTGVNVITVSRVVESWKESKVDWGSLPAASAADQGTATVTDGADDDQVDVDLTAMVQSIADSATKKWYGVLVEVDTAGEKLLHSSEVTDGDLRPVLEVEFTTGPGEPTNLRPTDDQAVSKAQPTFQWDYDAGVSDATQAGFWFELTDVDGGGGLGDFSAPLYASGFVASDGSEFDLSTGPGGPPSLDDDTEYWWRVMTEDDDGLDSEWSHGGNGARFWRRSEGVLTITSPGATVRGIHPDVEWTFVGRAQESVRIKVFRVFDSGKLSEVWDRGRAVTAGTSFQVPKGSITKPGKNYRAKVVVWDDVLRADLPGDRAWVAKTQNFVYTPNETGGDLLLVTPRNDPGVVLQWHRTAAPDSFALIVNGDEVVQDIDPGDVFFVDGSYNYKMLWFGAVPGDETDIEIQSVIAGRSSTGHPIEANFVSDPAGVWLLPMDAAGADGADGVLLMSRGGQRVGRSARIGEDSTQYFPKRSRKPVRITDTIRGYEGGISGAAIADVSSWSWGQTAQEYRDRLLAFKAAGDPVRLVMYGLNCPVELGELSIIPSADSHTFQVSFDFFQVGEFTFDASPG